MNSGPDEPRSTAGEWDRLTGDRPRHRARFGYSAPIGTTDDGRLRRITVHLPADSAQPLGDTQQGIGAQSANEVVAEGIQEEYSEAR